MAVAQADRPASSLRTIARLVRSDLDKLSRYWVILAGYAAIAFIALPGSALFYYGEQAINVTSASGYEFAFSLMIRCLDLSGSILYVMLCLLFSIDVANSTIKYLLTRPVTRMELLVSKYATAMLMVAATLIILWGACLGAGWYYYGLGDLTENEYVIFGASTMFRNVFIATGFLMIGLASSASMAVAVSTYSSTMGGAIIIGLILYVFVGALSLIPASLGFELALGEETYFVPYATAAFTSQVFVPMYILDNLPTGIAIDRWWTQDTQRMTIVCSFFFLFFFAIAALGLRKRDFTV